MSYVNTYAAQEPTRAEVEVLAGDTLLEFGAPWCGYCMAAQTLIESAVTKRAMLRHLKVEDGKGRPLGRAFRVKLWPTLILLRDGQELARVVRPSSHQELEQTLQAFSA